MMPPPPPPPPDDEAPTLTVTECEVLPPEPVQASVNVVELVSDALCALPAGGWVPLHAPVGELEAVQDVAFWLDQARVTVPPDVTDTALLVRLTVGAGGLGVTLSA